MKMKIKILACLLLLAATVAHAQFHVGIKAGANLNYTNFQDPKSYLPGFHAGAFARYEITDFLFLNSELTYTQIGGGYDSGYYYVQPEVFRQNLGVTFHSVAVPLFLSVTLPSLAASNFRPLIVAGAEYAYALRVVESYDNVYRYRGENFVSEGRSRNATSDYDVHQPSALFGAGVEFPVFGKQAVIDIRYKSTFNKTEIPNGLRERLKSLTVNVGVALF